MPRAGQDHPRALDRFILSHRTKQIVQYVQYEFNKLRLFFATLLAHNKTHYKLLDKTNLVATCELGDS